jgi:hypothetical protein
MKGRVRLFFNRIFFSFEYLLPLIAAAAVLFSYTQTIIITPSMMGAWNTQTEGPNHAYYGVLPTPPWGLGATPDSASPESTLILTEDATPLPEPHSRHDLIAKEGSGRYSHWGQPRDDVIIFSALDSSDPRTNGRTYVAQRPLVLSHWLLTTILAGSTLLALAIRYARGHTVKVAVADFIRRDLILFLASMVLLPAAVLLTADMSAASHPAASRWLLVSSGPILSSVALYFPNLLLGTAICWLAVEWLWLRRGIGLTCNSMLGATAVFVCLVGYFFILIDGQRLGAFGPIYGSASVGLLQFSDAAAYGFCNIQTLTGIEPEAFCQRRPYTAGMRLLTTSIAGANIYFSLMIQAAGVAGALVLLFVLLELYVGVPAALLFCGFVLLHTRPFAATQLTEMIGAFFSILSAGALLLLWKKGKNIEPGRDDWVVHSRPVFSHGGDADNSGDGRLSLLFIFRAGGVAQSLD